MNIVPGEPVPPGFEDEVNQVAEIQGAIDNHQGGPLIGLEYTVEVFNENLREPNYHCLLCDKRGDPRTIFAHWTSYNHRLKYLEKHFTAVIRELAPYRYPDIRNLMPTVVQTVATAIESHHGRLAPTVCESGVFKRNRPGVLQDIIAAKHFDERNGPSFVNIIDKELLEGTPKKRDPSPPNVKAPKRALKNNTVTLTLGAQKFQDNTRRPRNSLDSISSDSDSGSPNKTGNGKKRRKSQSPAYKVLPRVRRSPPFEEVRAGKDDGKPKTLPTPKELSLQASQIAQEKYKWEKYRCMAEIVIKDLENILKDYEKNPEKHPLYPEEWKKFWNRRYKELSLQKKDPNKYDYKPEWIVFWTRRMKEIHEENVEKKKSEIKIKLGLPPDAEEKTDELKQLFKIQVAPVKESIKDDKAHVIDISDDDSLTDSKPSKRKKNSRNRSYSRSLSPLSDDFDSRRVRRYDRSRSRERYHERDRSRSRDRLRDRYPQSAHHIDYMYHLGSSRSFYPHSAPPPPSYGGYRVMDTYKYPKYEAVDSPKIAEAEEPEIDDGPLTVVSVLRLLTALEDYLGSLGPKVVDMLGKALALEKLKANSSDEMLVNEDNCVFFETIKEKLKGQLIANVLDDPFKVKAVKKAIRNIAAIIHQVNSKDFEKENDDKSNEGPSEDKNNTQPKPAKTASDLPFDRQIVSTKLAAALVMQGKEDVTTSEMDKLIYLYILMVKLSKGSHEPVLTNDFVEELGIAPIVPPREEVEQEENHVILEKPVEEVESERFDEEFDEKEVAAQNSASALESLTDSDLQTLLQNFKHLSTEEQHHLIAHLKKLETADPTRVEKLRKYVNVSDEGKDDTRPTSTRKDSESPIESTPRRDTSPYQQNRRSYISDDEDDDYNFEDVVKIASNNVKRQNSSSRDGENSNASKGNISKPTVAALPLSIQDTQNVIANLMGSLQKSNSSSQNSNLPASSQTAAIQRTSTLPFYQQQQPQQPVQQQAYVNYPLQQQQQPYYNQYAQQNLYGQNSFGMFGPNMQQPYNYMGQQQQQPGQQPNYGNMFQRGQNM